MSPEGRLPRFKAGQFLHLTVDDYDPAGGFSPESRVFSIASPPGGDRVSIVYSVKGVYTRKMESRLKPGIDLWLKMPYGEFVIKSSVREGQDIVLVAGGTGISPFIPFLEERLHDGDMQSKVVLYYGARLRSYILFPDLLTRCAAKREWFTGNISIEKEAPDGLQIPEIRMGDGQLLIDTIFFGNERLERSGFLPFWTARDDQRV